MNIEPWQSNFLFLTNHKYNQNYLLKKNIVTVKPFALWQDGASKEQKFR